MDEGYFVEVGGPLENKLGITDSQTLQNTEYDLVARKIAQVIASDVPKVFNLNLLLKLHQQLFGEIYDFAGKIRNVNISKPDSPVPFAYYDCIPSEAERVFATLKAEKYLVGLDKPHFVQRLAWLSSELNALHPFREGNGRTIRLFLDLLCVNAGFSIDFNLVPHDDIIQADRLAFAGDLGPLTKLYDKIIQAL